jgi:hypothetical protein
MQHSCSQVLQESNLWANLSTALTTTFSSLHLQWVLAFAGWVENRTGRQKTEKPILIFQLILDFHHL